MFCDLVESVTLRENLNSGCARFSYTAIVNGTVTIANGVLYISFNFSLCLHVCNYLLLGFLVMHVLFNFACPLFFFVLTIQLRVISNIPF